MYIDASSVIASHTLRHMQTIHNIYNMINHGVTFTGQRLIERFARVYSIYSGIYDFNFNGQRGKAKGIRKN